MKDAKPVTKPVETKEKTLHKDEPVKVTKKNTEVTPPHLETYTQNHKHVFVSQLNKEAELPENIRLARFLADKTNENVYILLHIQPTEKGAEAKRKKYFPEGVKEGKNPDVFFRGRFVDEKTMKEKGYYCSRKTGKAQYPESSERGIQTSRCCFCRDSDRLS